MNGNQAAIPACIFARPESERKAVAVCEEGGYQYRFLRNKGTFQTGGDEILRKHCLTANMS
jgi:hypothetical protein